MKHHVCGSCGASGAVPFKGETFRISHKGLSAEVKSLSGRRCSSCEEIEFDRRSAKRYAAAGDRLVLEARAAERSEIRRIRRKLGLSQAMAARLTGGGHNAFSRYERGEAAPLPAVMNLFRLLDRHPGLLKELTERNPSGRRA
jgi:HTH-type transcriptional regulator / antitoxin MqsA